MAISSIWNPRPPNEVHPVTNPAATAAIHPAFETRASEMIAFKPPRFDLFLYMTNGSCALLIPAIQDQTGMGFNSWWMRG